MRILLLLTMATTYLMPVFSGSPVEPHLTPYYQRFEHAYFIYTAYLQNKVQEKGICYNDAVAQLWTAARQTPPLVEHNTKMYISAAPDISAFSVDGKGIAIHMHAQKALDAAAGLQSLAAAVRECHDNHEKTMPERFLYYLNNTLLTSFAMIKYHQKIITDDINMKDCRIKEGEKAGEWIERIRQNKVSLERALQIIPYIADSRHDIEKGQFNFTLFSVHADAKDGNFLPHTVENYVDALQRKRSEADADTDFLAPRLLSIRQVLPQLQSPEVIILYALLNYRAYIPIDFTMPLYTTSQTDFYKIKALQHFFDLYIHPQQDFTHHPESTDNWFSWLTGSTGSKAATNRVNFSNELPNLRKIAKNNNPSTYRDMAIAPTEFKEPASLEMSFIAVSDAPPLDESFLLI